MLAAGHSALGSSCSILTLSFIEERITASHANLIARLPQEHQAAAYDDENHDKTDEEILMTVIESLADDKLTGFALRLVLTDHVNLPRENEPDWLAEAEAAFAPLKPASSKVKANGAGKKAPVATQHVQKKSAAKKKEAA